MMDANTLRRAFLDFFEKRGHKIVPSSSLIPDDPSVLLTTAGMQQFKKYYTDPAMADRDFGSRNTASVQKSFRTSDIDEVGDERHLTFFEMLGNFSFGGYFKKEAIRYAYDFLKEVGLEISYVTIFQGKDDIGVPKDEKSRAVWLSLGIPPEKILEQGMEDVFWGPTGSSGPCGPTTEIYCKNADGRDVEIWNIVFNEFLCKGSREELLAGRARLEPLVTKGIDTGMGLERLAMISQNKKDIFETDLFDPVMSGFPDGLPVRTRRIIADHIRAVAFLVCDGVRPSNKEAGYVLRRLMRRVIAFAHTEEIGRSPQEMLRRVVSAYKTFPDYGTLDSDLIESVWREEEDKFLKTVERGRKEFEREADAIKRRNVSVIPRAFAFNLYQSAGITIDVLDDFAKRAGVRIDKEAFAEDMERHKEISRAGFEAKFGGHGLYLKTGEVTIRDESEVERVTRLHTATHLLHAGLRAILGSEARQDGSDITVERTRFDFRFPRKVTPQELKKVEGWVNDAIRRDLVVKWEEMSYEEGLQKGALGFFREKYPPRVKIYTVYDPATGEVVSCEFCGGPHVSHTGEVGTFKIVKEEASSAGVRRIRAVVE